MPNCEVNVFSHRTHKDKIGNEKINCKLTIQLNNRSDNFAYEYLNEDDTDNIYLCQNIRKQ